MPIPEMPVIKWSIVSYGRGLMQITASAETGHYGVCGAVSIGATWPQDRPFTADEAVLVTPEAFVKIIQHIKAEMDRSWPRLWPAIDRAYAAKRRT